MLKTLLIIVISLIALLIVGNVFTNPLQEYFIFQPVRLDKDFSFQFNQPFEEINLEADDGGKINALHFKSENAKGVILYFHGNAGNLVRWGELNDEFRAHQYDLFIMDYRGFGKSTGKQTQKTFFNDALQCYDYVAQQYQSEEIVIYGRSMGSGPASYLASQRPAKHLILETPFYSMSSLFESYYPILPKWFTFKFSFKNFKYIKKAEYPVTIFHGTNDIIVPYEGAEKLKTVLKEKDEFISIEGGTHNDLYIFQAYQEKLSEILN